MFKKHQFFETSIPGEKYRAAAKRIKSLNCHFKLQSSQSLSIGKSNTQCRIITKAFYEK